jgi:S1-C subfamily serine protease
VKAALSPFVLLAASALAGTTEDSIADATYLTYATGFRPYARPVSVVSPDGTRSHSTSVVIGDYWVLTAAHVVNDAMTVVVGDDNRVVTIWVHPEFEPGKFGFSDIAVMRCAEDFDLAYYPPLATGDEDVGDVVAIAGYGVTGRLSGGYDRVDGQLRAGTAKIKRFERTIIVSDARTGTPLPLCISPGDSGGPWFVGAGGQARVAGISSFTMRDKGPLRSRAGEEQGATRVSHFRDWIDGIRGARK